MLKRYERGELAAIDWLDALALARIRQLRVEVKLRHALQLLAAHRQTTGAMPLPSACGVGRNAASCTESFKVTQSRCVVPLSRKEALGPTSNTPD